MADKTKTNAMRKLDSMKIPYKEHFYADTGAISGTEVASVLGEDPDKVFKTLVTTGKSGTHYVFMIPVNCELDLKKAASAAGEKNIEMLKAKDLLPLTGYVHGGCSPIGMKKAFRTFIHNTADSFDAIFCSGGKIGFQIELSVENLRKVIRVESADVTIK
ncbi:MAG: Cys-tRNA(Pro) deacylase [Clostridia bacterium]|nr:Cys-tRNA(Pro) deacylase [Clostridia bacterium]